MKLTYDQSHAIATQRVPRLATTVYFGKIYGGVQVTDAFMRDTQEDILLAAPEGGYDGLYADAADIELVNLELVTVGDE